ncbi:hypothetical protein ABT095_26645 [Kitasatospora sp. NPDC002227]|uniref:DUF3761 domain-containing protein n=1 Tax=Kitasatospora sp. NPDC002227 TaxID=3154773 RepID=UPI003333DF06
MTRTPLLPRALAIAAVSVAAFLATACDPVVQPTATAGVSASASSAGSSPAAKVTILPAPTVTPTLPSLPPVPTALPSLPSLPAVPTTLPKLPPVPTSLPSLPAEPTGEPGPRGGSCGHHTVAVCGWDVGQTPAVPNEMAECKDGTASTSATPSGTCSKHGGVQYWFK